MTTVAQLMKTDEKAAIELFKKRIQPLNLTKIATDKLITMFTSAFSAATAKDCMVTWKDVIPLTDKEQVPYETLPEPANPKDLLSKVVIVKLNGGLGTTMGCKFPKCLIKFRDGKTFFDIVVEQVRDLNKKYGVNVPLVLMHSFYTDDDMKKIIKDIKDVNVITFRQNKFPRIYLDTLEPVPQKESDPIDMWNPPGHADVYHSLLESGLLEKFIKEGKEVMMISNIDNLGSVLDLKVLQKAVTEKRSYMCETVLKTIDDWKGGMPVMYRGKMKLLETAIVPKENFNDYLDMNFLNYFHANNLWVNLPNLLKALKENTLILDTMRNNKEYNGKPIVQLEAACGSAIQSFKDSQAVRVPRNRFLPVKSCNELLLVRSDVYSLDGSTLVRNPKRTIADLPSIQLNGDCYKHVSEFEKRFPHPVSMLELVKLVCEGDVQVGKNVSFAGNVEITAPAGQTIKVPDGSKLKDVVIKSQADIK